MLLAAALPFLVALSSLPDSFIAFADFVGPAGQTIIEIVVSFIWSHAPSFLLLLGQASFVAWSTLKMLGYEIQFTLDEL